MDDRPELPATLDPLLTPRYRVLSELGRGATAFVYLAEDRKHLRQVAIKVLRPEVAQAVGPDRFLREIRIATGLNHPGIVPVHDSGQAGAALYYVMPVVDGESLRARLERDGPLPLPDVVTIMNQLAAALDHAHARQIVHRDLKPENILLSGSTVLVTDFGVARAISEAGGEGLTEPGLAVGTPSYMSPEQAAADPRLDARSDVYSLGVVAYEMLTGEPPFRSASPRAVLARKLTDEIPPIRSVRDAVPAKVETVVMRALARVPADRYASAGEFAAALEAAVARDSLAPGLVARPRSRRVVLVIAGFLGFLLPAAWLSMGGSRQPDQTGVQSDRPVVAVLPFESLGGNAEDSLFAAGMHGEILTQLQKISSIGVIGFTSAQRHAGTALRTSEIARELNATALLVATIGRSDDRFRMRVHLLDGSTGQQLWAEAYADFRAVNRLFDVQERIALSIAATLEVVLTADERERLKQRPEPKTAAYPYYLDGELHHRNGRWSQALESFDSAVARDPGYAPVRAAIARTAAISHFTSAGLPAARERAQRALEEARQLAPNAPETLKAEGFVSMLIDGDYDRAARSFASAEKSLPNDTDLLFWAAVAYTLPLRLDSAAAINARALALDPGAANVLWQRGGILATQWKFREASRYFDRAAAIAWEHPMISHQRWLVYLWGLGDTTAARTILEKPPASIPHGAILDKRAWLAYVGRNTAALSAIVDSLGPFPGLRHGWNARLHLMLGNEPVARIHADSLKTLAAVRLEQAEAADITAEELENVRAELAIALALQGDSAAALRTIRLAVQRVEQQPDKLNMQETYQAEALTYAFLGLPELAIPRLDSIFGGRRTFTITPVALRLNPDYDGLRDHPSFEPLLAKLEAMAERS